MNEIASLEKQLEFHKKILNDLNDSIRNFEGITSSDDTIQRKTSSNRLKKRKLSDNTSRFEDDDEFDSKKVSLQSSVVTQSVNLIKCKEDLIKIQNKDSCSEQRNKRFLGVILGTLKKFKCEDKERSNTEKAQHRKEIEEKIEIKKVEEKKKMIEEEKKIEQEMNRNLKKIEIIEEKINLTESLNLTNKRYTILKNFIKTKSEPAIFFLPKKIDKLNIHIMDETGKNFEEEYTKKKSILESQLKDLDQELLDISENIFINTEINSQKFQIQKSDNEEFNEKKSNILKLEDELVEDTRT